LIRKPNLNGLTNGRLTLTKKWKITDEDWRNRSRWDDYKIAVNEMLQKTSTINGPWIVVEANDKRYYRIKVMKTIVEALEKELKK
jgi:AMP-polyphosphate phosphotransferase